MLKYLDTLCLLRTRLIIGASESNWGGYSNTLYGSVACLQLYDKELTADKVMAAYKQCLQAGAMLVP